MDLAIAILFGVLCFFVGTYAIIDGVLSLLAVVSEWGHRGNRSLLLLEGLVGLGAGFITLQALGLTIVASIFFIASRALPRVS